MTNKGLLADRPGNGLIQVICLKCGRASWMPYWTPGPPPAELRHYCIPCGHNRVRAYNKKDRLAALNRLEQTARLRGDLDRVKTYISEQKQALNA